MEYDKRNTMAIVANLRVQYPEAESINVCSKPAARTSLMHDYLLEKFGAAALNQR